jgi:hypothetical protein
MSSEGEGLATAVVKEKRLASHVGKKAPQEIGKVPGMG